MEKIERVRHGEAVNQIHRALADMQAPRAESPATPTRPLKPHDKATLTRQEQLIKIQEDARPKVD